MEQSGQLIVHCAAGGGRWIWCTGNGGREERDTGGAVGSAVMLKADRLRNGVEMRTLG